jgi:hypothetical protein
VTTTVIAIRPNAISRAADRNQPNEPNFATPVGFLWNEPSAETADGFLPNEPNFGDCYRIPAERTQFSDGCSNPAVRTQLQRSESREERASGSISEPGKKRSTVFAKRSQCSSKPKPLMNLRTIVGLDFGTVQRKSQFGAGRSRRIRKLIVAFRSRERLFSALRTFRGAKGDDGLVSPAKLLI